MPIALAGVRHWHTAIYAEAVRAAGRAISAVWDPDPAISAAIAAREHTTTAPSLDALLATQPELVVVMGHPATVPDTARAVLATGLPMILEKPAAPSTAALAALAPPPGRFVAVPLCNRLSPIWAEHARLGGTPVHAHFRIVNGLPERYRLDGVPWMLDPAIAGGGALRNLGLHALDAALSLLGPDPAISGAHVRTAPGETVDDLALATLTAPSGLVVTIETGYTVPSLAAGGDFEWRLATTNAWLADRGATATVTPRDTGLPRPLPPLLPGARYTAFLADTLARLHDGRPPLVTFADYLAAMRLADRIYAQATS